MWWVNLGGHTGTPVGWFVEGVEEFVRRAAEAVQTGGRPCKRAKPLLGLPIPGTGLGGAARRAGRVLKDLLPRLEELARELGVDLVLVAKNQKVYAAAQAIRRQREAASPGVSDLDAGLREEARRLAALAEEGRLVLFIGAGASSGAGLPMWDELLERLAATAGFGDAERHALAHLEAVDRARLIERRLRAKGANLGKEVALALAADIRTLSHTLLASLPIREVATTNERHKIYRVVPDADAERQGDLRIVDESGEDYLFSADRFVAIEVPPAVRTALLEAS